MNTRAKGTRMEKLAMEELLPELHSEQVASWRSVANKFNNTDFLSAWDFCLLLTSKRLVLCQVKSKYSNKVYSFLKSRQPKETLAFFATYRNKKKDNGWHGKKHVHPHLVTENFVFHQVF